VGPQMTAGSARPLHTGVVAASSQAVACGTAAEQLTERDECGCGRLLQWADRGREPAHQEGQAGRARLPQLRQPPPAAAAPLRHRVADAPDHETEGPLPTLGGVELRAGPAARWLTGSAAAPWAERDRPGGGSLSILAASCWVAATLSLSIARVRLARSAAARSTPMEVKNSGQPQPRLDATSEVSAYRRTQACRRAEPAQWQREETTRTDRRDAMFAAGRTRALAGGAESPVSLLVAGLGLAGRVGVGPSARA
jgi:hypothetical protein